MGHRQPRRPSGRAGEVRQAGNGSDDQVEVGHHPGDVEHVRPGELRAEVDDRKPGIGDLVGPEAPLKRDEAHAGHVGQRREVGQPERSSAVVAMPGVYTFTGRGWQAEREIEAFAAPGTGCGMASWRGQTARRHMVKLLGKNAQLSRHRT